MGFWKKVKGFFGIGGVKVSLDCPATFAKADQTVNGQVKLFAKSDQIVKSLEVKIIEEWTTGRGENKETQELDLGEVVLFDSEFEIKAQETKQFDFVIPYELIKSKNDELKDKGGVLGGLGKVGAFMDNEKSKYFIVADCDVKGTALDPSDRKPVQLQ